MRISLGNGVVQLVEGSPLSLRGARGLYLECTEGRVWCTLDGKSKDFVFGMGEQLRIENNGLALVQGSPCGSIRLVSEVPLPSRWSSKVIKPLHDLGWASLMAASAVFRLIVGLAGYSEYLVAGRGRVMSHLESNQP
jgi:hypothetical protein